MNSIQLQHIISQARSSIERDEAIGKQALANAAEKRLLLDALEFLQDENEQLRHSQKVENTYNINGDYIQKQIVNPLSYERGDE